MGEAKPEMSYIQNVQCVNREKKRERLGTAQLKEGRMINQRGLLREKVVGKCV